MRLPDQNTSQINSAIATANATVDLPQHTVLDIDMWLPDQNTSQINSATATEAQHNIREKNCNKLQ